MQLKLKKGFDINLAGKAENHLVEKIVPETYSFKPTSFQGIHRPKVLVQEGDRVKAGTPLFFDKWNDKVMFTAPVSGEIVAIERGHRRFPLEMKIMADKAMEYVSFPKHTQAEIERLNREQVLSILLPSGVWPNIVERPFGMVPNPEHTPKAIFISAFDSHPLAPDYEFVFKGEEANLQAGIEVLKKLTDGDIHVSIPSGQASLFQKLSGTVLHEVSGPHPAGNVGVQIHHVDPINKGEYVWTVSPYGLQQIGKLFLQGAYDSSKIICLAGSEVDKPKYYKTYTGASIKPFVDGNLKNEHVRYIAGNVLTGKKINQNSTLGYHDSLLTVIPEGDNYDFLGWILPTSNKLSFQKAFGLLSFLSPKKERVLSTNTNGEERAFVQTGVFEQVLPMDIYPIFLLKSILARDFEEMEALGIYELIEEDVALCEFVDVSKMDIQAILREGMDALQQA